LGLRYLRSGISAKAIARATPLKSLADKLSASVRASRPGFACARTLPCALRVFHAQNEIAPSARSRQGALPFGQPRCVEHRGCSLSKSDTCCQRQRL